MKPAVLPLFLFPLLLPLLPVVARAQFARAPDYEFAHDAVERGEILPLAEVLTRLHDSYPGRVVEVELEREDGMLIYEVELVTREGRLIEVEIDAVSGRIIELDEDVD
jgi:uncharacterized membrane protein YkoI